MRTSPGESANVVPFRRPAASWAASPFAAAGLAAARRDQRSLMETVYAAGTLAVAAGDRDTKLIASRLQIYGFVSVDQVETDGSLRRLRASEAIRAACDRPWRVTKTRYEVDVPLAEAGCDPADAFLFEAADGALDRAG